MIESGPCQNIDVDQAVSRARQTQPGWAGLGFAQRARVLRALSVRLRRDEELPALISEETGKPTFEATAFEVAYVCELTRFLSGRAGRAALCESRRSSLILPHKRARVAWRPRGVVAVIGPWNFPLLNNFSDAIAPLLAGNCVVLKPSPHTPRTSLRVQTLWRELGLPEGVFQVVEGGPEVGQALVDVCDMVFFTGSVAAGRLVASRAGQRMIPCVAELGGKSAMIVLRDADLRAAAHAAVWGAFAGAGQVCIRVERVLVEETVADEFVRLVVAETATLRVGREANSDMGPLVLSAQVERCRTLVEDALAAGAELVAGGDRRPDATSGMVSPTVLDRVPASARVMREETFGPVLPILRVADAEEALHLANDSQFGLSGSVWSGDRARALALARRLEAGSVCVNDVLVNYFFVSAPLGGAKQSGLGFRHGPEALRQFCYPQTIVEDRPWLLPVARWLRRQLGFPYRQAVLDVVRKLLKVVYR